MSQQSRDPSGPNDNSVVLDVRGMRVAVRTVADDRPVLVDDFTPVAAGRGRRPHRRIGRWQVDHRVGFDGLHAPRVPHRRGHRHVPRYRHSRSQPRRTAQDSRTEDRLCRPERRSLVQSRQYADQASLRDARPSRRALPGRGKGEAISLFRQLDLPSPETSVPLSPSSLRRTISAGHGRDGDGRQARHPDLDEPTTALDVTTQIECSPPSKAHPRA